MQIEKAQIMVHKFKKGRKNFLLDVNSGAVHEVSDLVYDILDFYPKESALSVVKHFIDNYDESEIKDAIDEIDFLIENDMLFTEDVHAQMLSEHPGESVVKAMCLHIAHDCNIRCEYCFASQGNFKGERNFMSFEVGKKALDLLVAKSGNRRNLEIDFFGGEPLMNFEVVKQLVEYGRQIEKVHGKNFRFTLTTNGVLLNDEKIDYINNTMDNVVLSIDGRKETNDKMRYTITGGGTYDLIIDKFKKLVERRKGKSYYVRGTFTKNNLDFANDVMHLVDQGFLSTSIEPVVASPNDSYALTEVDLPELYNQYYLLAEDMIQKQKDGKPYQFFHFAIDMSQGPCVVKRALGCGAGSEYLAVTPEGDLYPCHQFVGNPEFKMGDVFSGIDNETLSQSFRKAHIYSKPKCRNCWAKFYCSGGCHANAHNFNSDIYEPYELGCNLEKCRIENSIYLYSSINELESE